MKRAAALAFSLVLVVSMLTASAAETGYTDVLQEHWAYSDIVKAGQYGLMQGYEDGRFGLGDSLDRASFVTILCRMFSWETVVPDAPSYIDVSPEQWYYDKIETALANGALERSVSFRPEDPISREEMAVMLVRALGYEQLAQAGYEFELPFPDVRENRGYIALAWQIDFVRGAQLPDGTLLFQPNSAATREEAAAMLVRVYERLHSGIGWLHAFYAFSSYNQIALTQEMDCVSLGWARLELAEDGTPWVNTTSAGGNDWTIPQDPDAALSYLQADGTPYNLNVYSDASQILAEEQTRTAAAQAVADMAADYAGITMDFEGLYQNNRENFTAFMTTLRAVLPADKTLYVCVPDDTYYTGFDYRALGELCDKVILMAHDYQHRTLTEGYLGTTNIDNPVTPFSRIYRALASVTDPETGVADRSKLALAISFASAGWEVDEEGRLVSLTFYSPSPSTVIQRLRQEDTQLGWSEEYRNPYIYYTTESGARYYLWYEDSRSVMDKVHLAQMFGISGVSLWRLGNVPDYDDPGLNFNVWASLLDER